MRKSNPLNNDFWQLTNYSQSLYDRRTNWQSDGGPAGWQEDRRNHFPNVAADPWHVLQSAGLRFADCEPHPKHARAEGRVAGVHEDHVVAYHPNATSAV